MQNRKRKLSFKRVFLDSDEEGYPVEKLVGHRKGKGGRLEFLVRWEGYGEADDSWEPRSNLEGSLVQDYVNSADP